MQTTIFLVGPTAVGKTAVALELAHGWGGEIVSADSMQIYRGFDLGTAKPTAAERAQVRHHLIDVCAPGETFDVKQYADLATNAIRSIHQRGRTALVVGGTGLYVRALRRGLFAGPPRNPALRAKLEVLSAPTLFRELQRVDPATAATIDRQNPRRLIRALEVFYATGKPISELQREWRDTREPETGGRSSATPDPEPGTGHGVAEFHPPADRESEPGTGYSVAELGPPADRESEPGMGHGVAELRPPADRESEPGMGYGVAELRPPAEPGQGPGTRDAYPTAPMICLTRARGELYARIERRIDEQLAAGWLAEVQNLLSVSQEVVVPITTAWQAAGYRELAAHLRGELALAEAVRQTKNRTRQLARRQLTWFRREPGLTWLEIARDESAAATAARIRQLLEGSEQVTA